MEKTTLEIDLVRYDYNKRQNGEYQEIIKDVFKYQRTVRILEDKIELVNELVERLPIKLVGQAKDIKIKSIINIINKLLLNTNERLGYSNKKIYTNRKGVQHYTTAYKFFFVNKDD